MRFKNQKRYVNEYKHMDKVNSEFVSSGLIQGLRPVIERRH